MDTYNITCVAFCLCFGLVILTGIDYPELGERTRKLKCFCSGRLGHLCFISPDYASLDQYADVCEQETIVANITS